MTSLPSLITSLYDADVYDRFLKNHVVLSFLIILNLAGGIIGFQIFFLAKSWYSIDYYHPVFWFFIADCPVYAISFIIFLFKRNSNWFNGILFFHMTKYGFTGSIIWIFYFPSLVDTSSLPGFVGWWSHVFLMVEGLLVLPFLKFSRGTTARRDLAIICSWVVINEFMEFMVFDVLSFLGLFSWPEHLGPAPHGTVVLYPEIWNLMPEFFLIYATLDAVLLAVIFWRYFRASHQDVAVL